MEVNTTLSNQKLELIQWLSVIEDKNIIEQILKIKKIESADWWEKLSAKELESIELGLQDANEGKLKSHKVVKKLYEDWL